MRNVFVAMMLLLAACGACGDSAATDSGASDTDAALDAQLDVGPGDADAGDVDGAGPDADAGPDDPEWVVPSELPTGCTFEVAQHPERIPPLRWAPCFDGRPECAELVVDWGDWRSYDTLRPPIELYAGWGPPLLGVERPAGPARRRREMLAVAPETGAVIYALRYRQESGQCLTGHTGPIAAARSAMAFSFLLPPAMHPPQAFVGRVTPDPTNVRMLEVTHATLELGVFQRMRLSASGLIAGEVQPAYRVGTIRDGDFQLTDSGGAANHPVVVNDYLLFDRSLGGRQVVGLERPDRTVVPYIELADGEVLSLRTDGEWLAWVEARTPLPASDWARRTIRVARFAADPDDLAPIDQLELGQGYRPGLAIGGGWVVAISAGSAIASNLETGEQKVIPAPEGYWLAQSPNYVTSDEVAFTVAQTVSGISRTIWRVSLR